MNNIGGYDAAPWRELKSTTCFIIWELIAYPLCLLHFFTLLMRSK